MARVFTTIEELDEEIAALTTLQAQSFEQWLSRRPRLLHA
jgi:hypothetical protein